MDYFQYNDMAVPFDTLVANIKTVFNRATPAQYISGASWYYRANRYAKIISTETNVPIFIVSLVIAAVSPRQKWFFDLEKGGNLKSALMVIAAALKGEGPEAIKINTFNHNKIKGFDIMTDHLAGYIDPVYFQVKYFSTAEKTWNFANNINNPFSTDFVTIDGHATNLALNPDRRESLDNALDITYRGRYDILVRAYRFIAAELGVVAWQVQAVTWEVWART